jgi:CheY-like chemotaxis protein
MSTQLDAPPRRVLVVDDSRAIQAIIRRALEDAAEELGPLQVQTASDGAEALDKVAACRPDLVLSDWHMPGISGLELLQTLRQTGYADLPVGLVTTETCRERLGEARSQGASFVLNKPFEDRALRRAVAASLADDGAPAWQLPPDLPRGIAVESLAQLQQQLYMHLGTRSFDLLRAEPDPGIAEREAQLIALYGSAGRSGAYAIGLLDLNACCLIGGMAAGASPAEMLAAIHHASPSARQVDHAGRFMRACAAQLKKRSPSDVPALSTARLATQRFDKLASLLTANHGRSEFSLRLPGIGQGRLSFLLV